MRSSVALRDAGAGKALGAATDSKAAPEETACCITLANHNLLT